jgi:succinate-acetate transporter protein
VFPGVNDGGPTPAPAGAEVTADDVGASTRVVLRPLATPVPLAFLALGMATTVFSAVQLGWIPPTEGRVAGLTAVVAAVLQLFAAAFGYLARDPVAGTGVAVQAGTWALIGLATLTAPPGATSRGLGVLLIAAAVATLVPAVAGRSKLVPAAVLAATAARFAVTGGYELTASTGWKAAAGWVGLAVAAVALYGALALELEGAHRHTVLPVGRSGLSAEAVRGDGALDAEELAREPGVRPRL